MKYNSLGSDKLISDVRLSPNSLNMSSRAIGISKGNLKDTDYFYIKIKNFSAVPLVDVDLSIYA